MEKTQHGDEMITAKEKQTDQSVQDTQLPPLSPPHDTNTPAKIIKMKDVPDSSAKNINPLTAEDLKKILDQSTLQDKLCENPVLVSVDELQKAIADITRHKVNTQEPNFSIPPTTSGQLSVQTSEDTSTKVVTIVKVVMTKQQTQTIKEPKNEQAGQTKVSIPTIQTQGAPQIIVIDLGRSKKDKDIPKEKEQEAIQTLVNLPTNGTLTKVLQRPSTDAIPLQISKPGSSSTKVARVLHYGDPTLDEEIVIP